jgi:hypothetical protein
MDMEELVRAVQNATALLGNLERRFMKLEEDMTVMNRTQAQHMQVSYKIDLTISTWLKSAPNASKPPLMQQPPQLQANEVDSMEKPLNQSANGSTNGSFPGFEAMSRSQFWQLRRPRGGKKQQDDVSVDGSIPTCNDDRNVVQFSASTRPPPGSRRCQS